MTSTAKSPRGEVEGEVSGDVTSVQALVAIQRGLQSSSQQAFVVNCQKGTNGNTDTYGMGVVTGFGALLVWLDMHTGACKFGAFSSPEDAVKGLQRILGSTNPLELVLDAYLPLEEDLEYRYDDLYNLSKAVLPRKYY